MTTDLRIPDAGLIWVRRGLSYVAIPDPDAGTLCHAQGCRRPKEDGRRYCSDACKTADTVPDFLTCWRCFTPINGPGHYCPPCRALAKAEHDRRPRDWSVYRRNRPPAKYHGTCPTCGATHGQKCRSASGNTVGRDHKARPTPEPTVQEDT